MKTIDFTRKIWGHAAHSFDEIEATGFFPRTADKLLGRKRYSMIVHSMEYPHVGDKVRIKLGNGAGEAAYVEPVIYRVKCVGDPEDMYTLHVLFPRGWSFEKAAS